MSEISKSIKNIWEGETCFLTYRQKEHFLACEAACKGVEVLWPGMVEDLLHTIKAARQQYGWGCVENSLWGDDLALRTLDTLTHMEGKWK